MMAWDIGMSGPPPMPCRIRAMISVFRSGASPHSTDAPVNATVQIRKKRLRPKTLASQPVAGRTTALAARYEVSTHEISSTPAASEPCIWGSATLMTVTSSTCMTVTVMTVAVIAQRRTAPICGSDSAAAVPASSVPLIAPPDRGTRSPGIVAPAVFQGQLIEARLEVGGDWLLYRHQEVVELLGPARADDGRRDGRMRERPGHREPGERQARLLRERTQGVHCRELPLVPVAV